MCLSVHITVSYVSVSNQIARLREEGSRQLEEEQRLIKEQIQREREAQKDQAGSYAHTCMSTSKI